MDLCLSKKYNRGISLVTLVVTMVVLIIISGIVYYYGSKEINQAKAVKFKNDIAVVKQAVLQTYMKYNTMKDANILVGEKLDANDISEIQAKIQREMPKYEDISVSSGYYLLTRADLEQINVPNSNYRYIINYETGYVVNYTGVIIDGMTCYSLEDVL